MLACELLVAILVLAASPATGECEGHGCRRDTQIDLLFGTLEANNLGGLGPQEILNEEEPPKQYIRYSGVGYDSAEQRALDFLVRNTSAYSPSRVLKNGWSRRGDLGALNFALGDRCSMQHRFYERGTEIPAVLRVPFSFCFFHSDAEVASGVSMVKSVEVCHVAGGFGYYSIAEHSRGQIVEALNVSQPRPECYRFDATVEGMNGPSDELRRPGQVLRPVAAMTDFVREHVAPKSFCLRLPAGLIDGFEATYAAHQVQGGAQAPSMSTATDSAGATGLGSGANFFFYLTR